MIISMDLVPGWISWVSCHRVIVTYCAFVGPKFCLMGISWVQNIFLLVQNFLLWVFFGLKASFLLVFRGSKILSRDFISWLMPRKQNEASKMKKMLK